MEEPEPVPEPTVVRKSYPDAYTVVRGDTLWGIAARFLNDPWIWPQIWDVNSQIANPHLIFPGDVISLVWIDGQPRLQGQRPGGEEPVVTGVSVDPAGNQTVRLSPSIRVQALDESIPIISANAVQQFAVKPRVLTKAELEAAPYIIGNVEEHLISASGNRVYARGIKETDEALFSVYEIGEEFIDPDSREFLGVEAIYVADAKVNTYSDPSILTITDSKREVSNGNVLLPLDRGKVAHDYIPRVPDLGFDGRVISLFDAVAQSGQNQAIAINIGQRDGLEIGDILAIERDKGTTVDRYGSGRETVALPRERSGIIMIIRAFDRVSYGLIMESTHPIHLDDLVTNP